MARTLEIIQDNKINGFDLLAIHNPLFFIVQLNYETGDIPDFLNVRIFDVSTSTTNPVWIGRAHPYKDISGVARQYILSVSQVTMSILMPEIKDQLEQPINALFFAEYASRNFNLEFYENNSLYGLHLFTDFVALNGSAQIGDDGGACKIKYNTPNVYTCTVGAYVYVYCYSDSNTSLITVDSQVLQEVFARNSDLSIFQNFGGTQFKMLKV